MKKYIVIDPNDNVMVALEDFSKGDIINNILIKEDIKKGHKVAINKIALGKDIIKYGYPIGTASSDIDEGMWVHVHNVKTKLGDNVEYIYRKDELIDTVKKDNIRQVNVYLRKNGNVGIRNELWIIPTVGCVNGQANMLMKEFNKRHSLSFNFDGCFAFPHPYGCSQMGDDHENTKVALQDMVKHPNCGGVLVLALGCENNQLSTFKETLGEYDEERVRFINAQSVNDEIEVGLELLEELYEKLIHDRRSLQDISKINIGLKCGGSDGLSGLTANPLIGRMADYIVSEGGTAVLTEIPEMFGAEDVLIRRCESTEVFNNLVHCVNDFKDYYRRNNQVIYENPSPGNKAGGITTLEDKSLGCVQKSGKSKVVDVLKYGEIIKTKGLNVLSGPGNDLVATTALGISGCQLVLFSTGRGTPFGSFIPTVKISTNSDLYKNKPNWIDFNSGEINAANYDQITKDFIEFVISIIEGKLTKNEINDFHEIAIFKTGVTL